MLVTSATLQLLNQKHQRHIKRTHPTLFIPLLSTAPQGLSVFQLINVCLTWQWNTPVNRSAVWISGEIFGVEQPFSQFLCSIVCSMASILLRMCLRSVSNVLFFLVSHVLSVVCQGLDLHNKPLKEVALMIL